MTQNQSGNSTSGSNPGNHHIVLEHNLDPAGFKWLWAKYVTLPNLSKHCTACLRTAGIQAANGRHANYSRIFSKANNPNMKAMPRLILNERPRESFAAIYLCGVAARGYRDGTNYEHNLHAAVIPVPGETDIFQFEHWRLSVTNGLFTRIPTEAELSTEHRKLPVEFTSCRIFRWAACILPALLEPDQPQRSKLLLHPQ